MTKKFIEFAGNASTSAYDGDHFLGRNVSVAVYEDGDNVIMEVESNGERVKWIAPKTLTKEEYRDFCDKYRGHEVAIKSLESFGLTTSFS